MIVTLKQILLRTHLNIIIVPVLLDPFFSTKAGKKNSGLGLSICQHIIESHQGLITCTSGANTTFRVRRPVLESDAWESGYSPHVSPEAPSF